MKVSVDLFATIVAAAIAAIVAYFVAQYRISQDRRTRQKEWVRDRFAHMKSVGRALKRFERKLIAKKADVIAYQDRDIDLDVIGGMDIRYPEIVFSSETDKCILDDPDEMAIVDRLNELEEHIDELLEMAAEFKKDSENPEASALSAHLQEMAENSIELRSLFDEVKNRLANKLTSLPKD